jgi:hypothetical protein
MGFHDLTALSLNDAHPRKLPKTVSGPPSTTSSIKLDLANWDDDDNTLKMDMVFEGTIGYFVRSRLIKAEKEVVSEFFQKSLTSLGTSNNLKEFKLENLEARGEKLTAHLSFKNEEQSITRKGKTQINLSHLFDSYFESYDTSRVSILHNSKETVFKESLEIAIPAEKQATVEIPCQDLNNALFSLTCQAEEAEDKYTLLRTLTIKEVSLSKEEMLKIMHDINTLNSINESKLIVQQSQVD